MPELLNIETYGDIALLTARLREIAEFLEGIVSRHQATDRLPSDLVEALRRVIPPPPRPSEIDCWLLGRTR